MYQDNIFIFREVWIVNFWFESYETYLGDLSGKGFSLWGIAVSAELMLVGSFCYSAHGSDLIVAVIVVLYFLYGQGNRRNCFSKSWHTDLTGIGVGSVSAGDAIAPIARGMVCRGQGEQRQQSKNKYLKDDKQLLTMWVFILKLFWLKFLRFEKYRTNWSRINLRQVVWFN